jgi:hypothetical protein
MNVQDDSQIPVHTYAIGVARDLYVSRDCMIFSTAL